MPENVRYFADEDPERLIADALASAERERRSLGVTDPAAPLPTAHYLAISGGGDAGAFGAGLLIGWTESGARPEFKLVTGISTGALTAPFAFLGSDYDEQLKTVYTTIGPEDVFKPRGLFAAINNDGLADTSPLWTLVSQYANEEMLAAIGREYQEGRFLLIATTNLDIRRPVIWNIGEIALSGDPNAVTLFRSILIASASIPGAFPPVMIDVEADGVPYQEMHVDGGAAAQVFIYPPNFELEDLAENYGVTRERTVYVVRNAQLEPEWSDVDRQTLTIVGRAIASLIHSQGIGDLYRIYSSAQRDGLDYNLAFIPAEFDVEKEEEFDTAYMQALFEFGRERAVNRYPWEKTPPGFVDD
ncbi:MAG: patatin-like phospholipase family protein [Alphaproteobacteria bacterium]|nr:patatin-like phospholipase family protein [Alphaproteobacteria bacterium]